MEMLFSKEHEWICFEGNKGKIGITKFAADQLGDITYIELPKLNKTFKQNDVICTIESVKAASDIYAPVSLKIINVNTKLEKEPEIINKDPLNEGWIAEVEILNIEETKTLLSKTQYEEYIKNLH